MVPREWPPWDWMVLIGRGRRRGEGNGRVLIAVIMRWPFGIIMGIIFRHAPQLPCMLYYCVLRVKSDGSLSPLNIQLIFLYYFHCSEVLIWSVSFACNPEMYMSTHSCVHCVGLINDCLSPQRSGSTPQQTSPHSSPIKSASLPPNALLIRYYSTPRLLLLLV